MLEINMVLHNITNSNGGLMKFLYKIEQGLIGTSPIVIGPLNNFVNLDPSNALCNVSDSVAANQFILNVIGIAANLN